MDEHVDHLKAQGDATKKSMDDNRTKLDAKGFKQAKYDSFVSSQNSLTTADKTQAESVEAAESATDLKSNTKAEALELIEKVNFTVMSTWGTQKAKRKTFKVDELLTGGYNGIIDRCEYLGPQCETYIADLIENGMTADDVANIKAMPDKLRAANAGQNTAKKAQKAATGIRDDAAKAFKSELNKILNFVKANFAKDKAMLTAFEPIPKGGGGRNQGGNDTPPPTPPAQ